MHPLKIAATPGAWAAFMARKAQKAFRAKAERVLARDHYTCYFCGFQARQYQEVVNKSGNFSSKTEGDLVCACCFCTQCLFIESVGEQAYGGGTVVYLPEMSQPELNSLCHVLFCAIANGTAYRDTAQTVYRALRMRAQQTEDLFGEGTSTPAVLGQLLVEYQTDYGDIPQNIVTNLRLLPSRASFKTQIERWAAAALAELTDSQS